MREEEGQLIRRKAVPGGMKLHNSLKAPYESEEMGLSSTRPNFYSGVTLNDA
jgi:hypothetical protein